MLLLVLLKIKWHIVKDLVKKSDYDADLKDKHFITSDYNKFANNILDEKITLKTIVNESVLTEKKKTTTKEKTKNLATKEELKPEQD